MKILLGKKLVIPLLVMVMVVAVTGIVIASSSEDTYDVDDLSAGDLVITEIMKDPKTVDDTYGEWFEVLNKSGMTVDLKGLEIKDTGTNKTTILSSVVIADGDYAVLGRNGDTSINGGVELDYDYGNFWLEHDNADEIILQVTLDSGSVKEIDRVAYDDGATFPDPTGASMSLDPRRLSATDNDAGSNWCEATRKYNDVDYGTPGTPNDFCGGILDQPPLSTSEITLNGAIFTVTLNAVAVDDDLHQTWTYTVTQSGNPALSHWTLGIDCDPGVQNDDDELWNYIIASNPQISETGKDGQTGIWGIKWDTSEPTAENDWTCDNGTCSKQFSFTMGKPYNATTVHVLVKAGDGWATDYIMGPDCAWDEPVTPFPEWSTIILMSLGLVGLAGFVWFKRRRNAIVKT